MALAASRRRFTEHDKFKPQYQQRGFGNQGFGNTESKGRYNTYYCDHCKMSGHSIQRCYKLNGYPQNYKGGDRRFAANTQVNNEESSNSEFPENTTLTFTPSQYQ